MKNKQIIITLHEGCLDPKHPFVQMFQVAKNEGERRAVLHDWLWNRLHADFDCIQLDKVEIIDCDCERE